MFLLMCRFCEMTTLHSAVWPTDRAVGLFRAGLWGAGKNRPKAAQQCGRIIPAPRARAGRGVS